MPGPFPLPTLAVVFGPNGPVAPVFEDVLASLQATFQSIYGANVYLGPDSTDGQWLAIMAQFIYDANQMAVAVYNAFSPAFAQGIGLSSVVRINGLFRDVPTNSTAPLTVIGAAGTPIPAGIVQDAFGNNWDLPTNLTIPGSGEIDTTVTCETPGAITAEPGTINKIVTIIPGWQSATNPQAATPGAPVESDAMLRQRQAISTSMPAQTPRMAVAAAVAAVPGVQRSFVYQNDSDFPDANGIPPHSIAAVVAGGQASQIFAAIASKKSEGTGTLGSASAMVVDAYGVPNAIAYFPLALQPIFVALTITPLPGYLATTGNLITASIAAYINGLAIGAAVSASPPAGRLVDAANLSGSAAVISSGLTQAQLDALSATYLVTELAVGISAAPTQLLDVPIPFNAAASCPPGNVVLTVL